jgi:hypothetical protein
MESFMRERIAGLMFLVLGIQLSAFAQTADDLFDPGILQELRIDIHPVDWRNLHIHFDENTHYAANFHWIFNGNDIRIDQVSVRSRGEGSRNGVKPGLLVQFDRFTDQPFLGLKALVLRNNAQDASMLRERVAMRFMDLFGIPAPREAHARLYVNGTYAGLYSIVENIDESFLRRVFGQTEGYLYEYKWSFFWFLEYLGIDPARYSPVPFEPKTHEQNPDPRPLEQLIRAINETPDAYFEQELSHYLDLRYFMTYIAVENFLAEQDGLLGDWGVNNFYLYRFENSLASQVIPWDKSQSFNSLDWPIFRHVEGYVLARRAMAIPELRRVYLDTLRDCVQLAGEGGWLEQEIVFEYQQVRDAALEDPFKQCYTPEQVLGSCSNEQFERDVEYLIRFSRERGMGVLEQLNALPETSRLQSVDAQNGAPVLLM